MIVKNNSVNDIRLRYRSPEVKVIEFKAQGVLCQSGNKINDLNLREDDSDNWS